ncbi:MAG: Cytochrome c-type protein NrfH [Calditrichaeota bacterium]|nr:Cytochrome c-type protein NrfH [Calditrichota bacterium]
MRRLYLAFLRGVSANKISRTGVVLTTTAFFLFISFEALRLSGMLHNAYVGLISYLGIPIIFVIGLALIPFGWWRSTKLTGRPFWDLFSREFSPEDITARRVGARVIRVTALLTLANFIFLGAVSSRTLHFMDEPHFCGTACHQVMDPEWTTYQQSPHAEVKCVECHVGEGLDALVNSKLNGAWQVISATFELYEKPIPTPVHTLRPARETCEECHWPQKFHGNTARSWTTFRQDSLNTPRYSTLLMKTGSGGVGKPTGSHWHIAEENTVRYASIDDERETMIWVEVKQDDGSWKRYMNTSIDGEEESGDEIVRVMDCVDCHNRATHIYEEPEKALDERMERGMISRDLPYIKKRALGALLGSYPDKPTALEQIDLHIRNFYQQEYPELLPEMADEIDEAVAVTQAIYDRNIHPEMSIDWGAYPSHLGHEQGPGCFRCHDFSMESKDGDFIPMDCDLCHTIIADEDREPPTFLDL